MKVSRSTVILSVGIIYSMRDLIRGVNYSALPETLRNWLQIVTGLSTTNSCIN